MFEKKSKHSSTRFGILVGGVFLVGVIVGSFWVSCMWIKESVKDRCAVAISQYEGDCVEALMQVVDGEDINSFRKRNQAIWALGQLGDDREGRTTEILEKYYTGNIPKREPYDADLSQYEIKKALELLGGGWNITHFVWRPEKLLE